MEKQVKVSALAANYPASGIRKMFDLASHYPEAIKLTVGEPNFDTPQYVKDAAKEAIDAGMVHYTPNAGIDELRQAVAKRYAAKYWDGYTANNVVVTCGANEAIALTLFALIDSGDEVLVADPCYPNYFGQIQAVGASVVKVPTSEENGFAMKAADIEKVITPKTKAIIINSPCNPTGVVMSEEDLREVAKVVEKYDLFVLSDEPYDALVYDGVKAFSLAQIPEIRNKVFVLNSFSKTYAMTGWRVGYVIVPDGYAVHFAHLNEGLISCIPGFIQHAAAVALQSDECVKSMLADYTRRRDILVDGINAIPGFSCPKPRGSFYAFCNIKAFGKTSQEFAEELLTKAGVVVVPGSAFGACGEGYVRLVFANSDENLQEAVRRIASYVQSAYPNLH